MANNYITLSQYQTGMQRTKEEMDKRISSAYKVAGSIAFASLPAAEESKSGYVYNITNSFTTTADFVEGAGKTYPAGTNVVIAAVGDGASVTYKYDVLAGFIDLSGYVEKETGKGLSSNDFTTAEKNKLANIGTATDSDISDMLDSIWG